MVHFDDDDFKKMQLSQDAAREEFSSQKRWVQVVMRHEQLKFSDRHSEKTSQSKHRAAEREALNERLCAIDDELTAKEAAQRPNRISRGRKATILWNLTRVLLVVLVIYGVYHVRVETKARIQEQEQSAQEAPRTHSTPKLFPQLWEKI